MWRGTLVLLGKKVTHGHRDGGVAGMFNTERSEGQVSRVYIVQ